MPQAFVVARASCPWSGGTPPASVVLDRYKQERGVIRVHAQFVSLTRLLGSMEYHRSVRRTAPHGRDAHATSCHVGPTTPSSKSLIILRRVHVNFGFFAGESVNDLRLRQPQGFGALVVFE